MRGPGPLVAPVVEQIDVSSGVDDTEGAGVTRYQYSCPQWSAEFRSLVNWGKETATADPTSPPLPVLPRPGPQPGLDSCGPQVTQTYVDALSAAAQLTTTSHSTTYSYPDPPTWAGSTQCQPASQQSVECSPHVIGKKPACVQDTQLYTYDAFGNTAEVDDQESTGPARKTLNNYFHADLGGDRALPSRTCCPRQCCTVSRTPRTPHS